MTEFRLTDGERAHPMWSRIKAHLVDQLAGARTRNDRSTLTEQETAALRGEIACLKKFIALGDEQPVIEE